MSRRILAVLAGLLAIAVLAVPAFALTSDQDHPPHATRPTAASLDSTPIPVGVAAAWAWLRGVAMDRYLLAIAYARTPHGGGGCADGDWECFKACTLNAESHSNYGSVSSGGTYRGGYQYSQAFWDGQATEAGRPDLVGQDPATASPEDQDYIAQHTYSTRGNDPWMGRC